MACTSPHSRLLFVQSGETVNIMMSLMSLNSVVLAECFFPPCRHHLEDDDLRCKHEVFATVELIGILDWRSNLAKTGCIQRRLGKPEGAAGQSFVMKQAGRSEVSALANSGGQRSLF